MLHSTTFERRYMILCRTHLNRHAFKSGKKMLGFSKLNIAENGLLISTFYMLSKDGNGTNQGTNRTPTGSKIFECP